EKERHARNKKKPETAKWQNLAAAVENNDPVLVSESLEKIVETIGKSNDLDTERQELLSFILFLYDKAEQKEVPNYLTDRCVSAISEINYLDDPDEMTAWIKKNFRSLLEASYYLPSIKNADMIYSALHYINANYKERITLQQISDYVHFSPPYFSKMFKKELNTTFTQYLTKVRIEASKKLLADSSLSLSDIPEMVGFEEQSYFTKVFRAVTGTSPGKYRDHFYSS
ncbi:MAG: AraC family transcriptional regulator, partial [Bacillota bacterium]|nr:AraC family transcriptional regulator [Bacillota bacterium]